MIVRRIGEDLPVYEVKAEDGTCFLPDRPPVHSLGAPFPHEVVCRLDGGIYAKVGVEGSAHFVGVTFRPAPSLVSPIRVARFGHLVFPVCFVVL